MSITAIGFDLDDTLYDRNELYKRSFETMEQEVIETGVLFEVFNLVFQKYSELEYDLFMAGQKDKDTYSKDRVVRAYGELGFEITGADGQYFNDLYHKNQSKIALRPGAEQCLKLVSGHNLVSFVLTNGAEVGQQKKLDLLHMERYINPKHFFISGAINVSKPEKEIFNRVIDRLALSSENILYIGDNLENDVHGALNAGWQAIWFDEHNKATGEERFPVINSLNELYDYLQML